MIHEDLFIVFMRVSYILICFSFCLLPYSNSNISFPYIVSLFLCSQLRLLLLLLHLHAPHLEHNVAVEIAMTAVLELEVLTARVWANIVAPTLLVPCLNVPN